RDYGVNPVVRCWIPRQYGTALRVQCRHIGMSVTANDPERAADANDGVLSVDRPHVPIRGWVPRFECSRVEIDRRQSTPGLPARTGEVATDVERVPVDAHAVHQPIQLRVPGGERARLEIESSDARAMDPVPRQREVAAEGNSLSI